MIFAETAIAGVTLVRAEPSADDRGSFARLHCVQEFGQKGHWFQPVQTSLSRNPRPATLRGMHFQIAPYAETKLVRVLRGRAFDVALDLRAKSPTYLEWVGLELNAQLGPALLIGEGIAHGFLTLEPDTDILYQISPAHSGDHARGVRWNDPAFNIKWPFVPKIISDRDAAYPDYRANGSGS